MAIMNDVSEVLHKIVVKLYPNYLGKGGGAYIARSRAEAPLSIENICASAKNRGGFTGQYEDLLEHSHVFINEAVYQLLDGFSVNIGGFFSLHTHIGGTYNGERDHIDASKISVGFHELNKLKELLGKIEVTNEGPAGDGAFIDEIIDAHTGSRNEGLTIKGMLNITGHKIKVEGSDPACGVWFVRVSDGGRTKVTENFGLNRPSELMVQIPLMPLDKHRLEIVTQYAGGGSLLKEPRTIAFAPELAALPAV